MTTIASIILLNGLKQLQNRGYDSSGICTLSDTFSTIKYASNKEDLAIKMLERNLHKLKDSYIGIGHTRWATHGCKTDVNSHPHISYDGKISLVHNGIIENYNELKKDLINNEIKFKSQTDTEVISNLLAYEYQKDKDFTKCLTNVISKLKGTFALAILNIDKPNRLYCVKYENSLLISHNEDFVLVSSEQSGFCGNVNNYIILDNNDICIIEKNKNNIQVKTKNKYVTKNISLNEFKLTPYPYNNWTIKEIEEQPKSLSRAINIGGRILQNNIVKLSGLDYNKNILINIDNLILLGCGTSYNAGLLGINYFKDLCNFNTIQIFDGAEFTEKDIPKNGKTAIILLSQSGETKDLHRCIKIGKDNNLFLIGVINVIDSMIARDVHCVCYLNVGREIAVASTKAFTGQVTVLAMISIWFSQIQYVNRFKRQIYVKCLRKLSSDIDKSIKISKKHKKMYIDFLNKNNLFVLGKGKSMAVAEEGSLKIKEISYIHSEAYSGSSLKHGPFSLLDKNFPVILLCPDDEHYVKMDNVYNEIKSRETPILFITTKEHCDKENSIILPKNEIFGDLLCVIPLQLIAYYLSIERGIVNIDFPKNLAKVCTTE